MKNLTLVLLLIFQITILKATEINNNDLFVLDSTEINAFMDGIVKATIEERNIAGATLIIVSNGKTVVKKGYGYADIDNQIKVNPDSTLFRIGSISKLFTWIAVMQLVEQGVYDLDTDINEYLESFKVPDTFSEPVTIRSLLSHTPGFEDKLYKLFVKSADEMPDISEIFNNQMPKRVRPPLEYASYSNHGTGLVQYLVEKASKLSFEKYSEKHIFPSLGLQNTTFRQPIPQKLQKQMSKGYTFENGVFKEKYFEFVPMTGVGGASTTAADMGKFIEALLNYSCLDTLCLLDTAYYKKMLKPVLTHAEGLNSSLLGFMDLSRNNMKIFGHGGDTFWFHSGLAVIPDYNTGIFLSFNSYNGGGAYAQTINKFIDRYFPDDRSLIETVSLSEEYLEKFTGQYKATRHSHTDLFKLLSILNPVEVSLEDDYLRINNLGDKASFWEPIDSLRFRNKKSNELIAFELDANNERAKYLFVGNFPIVAFERLKGFNSPQLHSIIIIVNLITIIFILLFWPFIALIRRKYQRMLPAPQLIPFPAKLVAWICAACFMAFYLLLSISSSSMGEELIMRIPWGVRIGLFFPFLAIPFLLLMMLQAIILWKMKDIKWRSRLFYYFSIIVFLAFYWQIYYWNLLGWNY